MPEDAEARAIATLAQLRNLVATSVELSAVRRRFVQHGLTCVLEALPVKDTPKVNRSIVHCRMLVAEIPKLAKALLDAELVLEAAGVPLPLRSRLPHPSSFRKL